MPWWSSLAPKSESQAPQPAPSVPVGLPNLAAQWPSAASQAQPTGLQNLANPGARAVASASAQPVAVAAAPAVLRFPVPPLEDVPGVPASFPETSGMSEAEMSYLRDNPVALQDWLHGLLQVRETTQRLEKLREEHQQVANQALAKESQFSELQQNCGRSAEALRQQQSAVQALLVQRDQVLQQQSPQQLAAVLDDRAQASDTEAQQCLEQIHMAPNQLDAQGLANFRTQYLQKMTEKHTRLALKERLIAAG